MYAGTLAEHAQAALAILAKSDLFKTCYLAGCTALALQLGHRKSQDLNFCTRKNLRAADVAKTLKDLGNFKTTLLQPPHTLIGEFEGVKMSLFRYDYPLIAPSARFQEITIAGIPDIAAMKLTAIGGRATKRDYVDIYVITQKHPLEEQFTWYEKKFGDLGNNLYVIIKALGYFEDSEQDNMPEMLTPLTWEKVKSYLAAESLRLGRKYIEGK